MINHKRVSDLKEDLKKQVCDMMDKCNYNTFSFDAYQATVSKIKKRGDGNIDSLLSIADNMNCDIVLVPRK